MGLTLQETLFGLAGGGVLLVVLLLWIYHRARPAYPIRCVHCWVYENRERVVGYSHQPDQWAVCSQCVRHYWHFDDEAKESSTRSDLPPRETG
ncbi:MAG TPA: hypothetical protein P5568_01850 [Acidobacteriota bacterium]|nr:hypothetical protein [Acidobacteriota bacterium]HRR56085.1 hypothetical protein [Acidobacteriota bacterium]HRV07186.1 hypothetical protein [Acidobacteriota bacterium]